jgi:hypothetical protein
MFQISPLLAFGFASLPMLGWLAAAAVPILIHLWSRRRYREMPWAAMDFLLAALREQARRLRFEQWLLLLVRILVVALVVLAVSEPYRAQNGVPLATASRTHRVLVIDASLSMAYKLGDHSRFEAAKELATQIVEKSPQGDAFTLVQMAAPPRVMVGNASFETHQVRDEIASLEQLHTTADLPATIAVVRHLIETAARNNPRLTSHEVYFFTDLQRATWAPALTAAALADFQRESGQLAKRAALSILDVGQPSADNLAVTTLVARPQPGYTVVTTGHELTVAATLRSFGREPRKAQVTELLVDGRRAAQRVVDMAGGGDALVEFPARFETPGDHSLEVRTPGDALEADNHRYLVLPVRQALNVLCIDGRPSAAAYRGATGYLAAALAPEREGDEHGQVHVDVAAESAILERDLARYDCLFLANVGQFTASEARVLEAYLKHGGGLVFFLGDQVQAARYNAELGGENGRPAILPARLGMVVTQWQSGLNPLGYRHPIVAAFRGQEKGGLLSTPVERYVKLEVPRGSTSKTALALKNGDPLLVTQSVHRGRVVLAATSADVAWTPMPLWKSYVPIVQEILAWCVAPQTAERNVLVGEPVGGSLPVAAGALTIERPDGQSRQVMPHDEGDQSEWTYGDTTTSGFYTARRGSPANQTQTFAVNVDTRESDLTPVSQEELRSAVWPGIEFHYATTWQDPHVVAATAIGQPRPLCVGVLYAAFTLLLVETVLAWRFGYHTR